MDVQTAFYLLLFVFWLISQLVSAAKKARRAEAPPPTRRPLPRPVGGLDREAQQAMAELQGALGELDESLPELDPHVGVQTSFLVDQALRSDAETATQRLESAIAAKDMPALSGAVERAREIAYAIHEITTTAQTHSAIRRRPETVGARIVADRILDDFQAGFGPFAASARLDLGEAPPVALIWNLGDDRLATSPLAGSTIFVPPSVTTQPLDWALLPFEIARYLGDAAPDLYREISDKLELRVTESDIASRPETLARFLLAAYVVRFLGDVIGATFFGPTYLRVLSRVHAKPQAPVQVTTVRLNPDGTVNPEPPPHLRVRWISTWLTSLGYASEAADGLSEWTERHQNPSALALTGASGSLPLAPIASTLDTLTEQLYLAELETLGSRRLAELPGISDWRRHAKNASTARSILSTGKLAEGSPRQLVVAAMDAALGSPERSETIGRVLNESLATPVAAKQRRRVARGKRPSPPKRPSTRPRSREIVEALILSELILERPHRRRGAAARQRERFF